MCGRYVLSKPGEVIEEVLDRLDADLDEVSLSALPPPRFNVAPTQEMPIVLVPQGEAGASLVTARWSFSGSGKSRPMINARAETVLEKPTFEESFRTRRCLVPADGFYEWRASGNRQPFLFRRPQGQGFCFAGLWKPATPSRQGSTEDTPRQLEFLLMTAAAGPVMKPIHHRRPVSLDSALFTYWLARDSSPTDLLEVLRTSDPELDRHPVSFRVNSVRFDEPHLLEMVDEAPTNSSLF